MRRYKEITADNSASVKAYAIDNEAEYTLTSARAKDIYRDYIETYGKNPTAKWLNKNFRFERVR